MTAPRESAPTPWYKIYGFILLFNAILVLAFYLLRLYFNID